MCWSGFRRHVRKRVGAKRADDRGPSCGCDGTEGQGCASACDRARLAGAWFHVRERALAPVRARVCMRARTVACECVMYGRTLARGLASVCFRFCARSCAWASGRARVRRLCILTAKVFRRKHRARRARLARPGPSNPPTASQALPVCLPTAAARPFSPRGVGARRRRPR